MLFHFYEKQLENALFERLPGENIKNYAYLYNLNIAYIYPYI